MFVEMADAFSSPETERIRQLFDTLAGAGNIQSFTLMPRGAQEVSWVYDRMCALALRADQEAGWGLLASAPAVPTDEIVYDRFGPG